MYLKENPTLQTAIISTFVYTISMKNAQFGIINES